MLALDRSTYPYRPPTPGEPLRVIFVGSPDLAATCALHAPARGLRPSFVDAALAADPPALAARLRTGAPHVVVALGADALPAGAVAGLPAACVALAVDGLPAPGAVDRVITSDPAVDDPRVWRSMPPPVDDRLFATVRPAARPARTLYLGASTPWREQFLVDAKHAYDLLHYAHGLRGDALVEVLGRVSAGVVVPAEPVAGWEPATLLHLAAGHLLIAATPRPAFGLEAEIDFVEVQRPEDLMDVLFQLHERPDAFERIRHRGRAKAEGHRASAVWSRVVADLIGDIAVAGPGRPV